MSEQHSKIKTRKHKSERVVDSSRDEMMKKAKHDQKKKTTHQNSNQR